MRPVSIGRRKVDGFTIIEIMVAVVILSILMALGIPTMSKWLSGSRAQTVAEFYAEGLKLARSEALKRNAVSRLSLIENSNGQYDWQVDICVPTPTTPCRDDSGSWSTPAAAAAGSGVGDFLSVVRSANPLPKSSLVALTVAPTGADSVYFTPIGWVDGTIGPSLNRITVAPAAGHEDDFPTAAVAVTLAGVVTKCNPTITGVDSRNCP